MLFYKTSVAYIVIVKICLFWLPLSIFCQNTRCLIHSLTFGDKSMNFKVVNKAQQENVTSLGILSTFSTPSTFSNVKVEPHRKENCSLRPLCSPLKSLCPPLRRFCPPPKPSQSPLGSSLPIRVPSRLRCPVESIFRPLFHLQNVSTRMINDRRLSSSSYADLCKSQSVWKRDIA